MKTIITNDQLKFDFLGRVERLAIDTESMVAKKAQDPLKLKKNIDQLYHVLKKKHEQRNQNLNSEALTKNVFKLAQIGIHLTDLEQALVQEKYFISQQKEESEAKQPNQFATTLGDDTDIQQYLTRYTDFMLYNLVHLDTSKKNTLPWDKETIFGTGEERWDLEARKLLETYSQGERLNPFNLGSKIYSKSNSIKSTARYGLSQKRSEYFAAINNFITYRYIMDKRESVPVPSLVDEFAKLASNTPEINELWKILGYQVMSIEQFRQKNDPILFAEQMDLNASHEPIRDREMSRALNAKLVRNTCRILEEEYRHQIMIVSKNSQHYRNRNNFGVNDDVMTFVHETYLSPEFLQTNYVQFDTNNFPVWAVCYVFFRSGKLDNLKDFLNNYSGSLERDTQRFVDFLEDYIRSREYLPGTIRAQAIQEIENGSEFVDVFQQSLYFLITKHAEIPSDELIAKLGDYLWFNLKISNQFEDLDEADEIGERRFLSKSITLNEIQQKILQYGPTHFNAGNRTPLTYIKTLFIVLCHDEALHYLQESDSFYEELVHFAIILKESDLLNFRTISQKVNDNSNPNKYSDPFSEADFNRLIIDYAMGFSLTNPIEAALYLRLLKSRKDLVNTVSSFIISNDQIGFFFDNNRESIRNAKRLQDILGHGVFRDVVIEISKCYKKNNLDTSVRLLDLIEDYEQVMNIIIDEEFKNIGLLRAKVNMSYDESFLQSPLARMFWEIIEKYKNYGITKTHNHLYSAFLFMKKVQEIFIFFAKRKYQDGLNYLLEWNPFSRDQARPERFRSLHEKVQLAYLDLMWISTIMIREHYNAVKASSAKSVRDSLSKTLEIDQRLISRISEFFASIRNAIHVGGPLTDIIKRLESEIIYATTELC